MDPALRELVRQRAEDRCEYCRLHQDHSPFSLQVRHGGLHAAAGTLGASASGSVRLALLGVVFRSAGLPGAYPQARLLMWLRSEGILEEVHRVVEASGCDWEEEVDNFLVAESLHEALVQVKPKLFATPAACLTTLTISTPMFPT